MKTAQDIRRAFKIRYPDVDNDKFAIEHSGFVHEHPMTAIGTVLISSILLGTTDVCRLAEFTRYSQRLIRVIAANMENSYLWRDGKYDCAAWSSGNLFPRDEREDRQFWEHIEIAEGSAFTANAKSFIGEDVSLVFWDLKRTN